MQLLGNINGAYTTRDMVEDEVFERSVWRIRE